MLEHHHDWGVLKKSIWIFRPGLGIMDRIEDIIITRGIYSGHNWITWLDNMVLEEVSFHNILGN